MGKGNDDGLWGDRPGHEQGWKVCPKKVSQRGSGRLQSFQQAGAYLVARK